MIWKSQVLVQTSIFEFELRLYSSRSTECNTKILLWRSSKKNLDDEVLNLESDPKEHFNLGLHIYIKPIISTCLLTTLAMDKYGYIITCDLLCSTIHSHIPSNTDCITYITVGVR